MKEINDVILKADQLVEGLYDNEFLRAELYTMLKKVQKLVRIKVETDICKRILNEKINDLLNRIDQEIERLQLIKNTNLEQFETIVNQITQLTEKKEHLKKNHEELNFACITSYPREEQELIHQCMESLSTGKFGYGSLFGESLVISSPIENNHGRSNKNKLEINKDLIDKIIMILSDKELCQELHTYIEKQIQLNEIEQDLIALPKIIEYLEKLENNKQSLSLALKLFSNTLSLDIQNYEYSIKKEKEQLNNFEKNAITKLLFTRKIIHKKRKISVLEKKLECLKEEKELYNNERRSWTENGVNTILSMALEDDLLFTYLSNSVEKEVATILREKMTDDNFSFEKEIIDYKLKLSESEHSLKEKKTEFKYTIDQMSSFGKELITCYLSDCKSLMNILNSSDHTHRNPMISIYILNIIWIIANTNQETLYSLLYNAEDLKQLERSYETKINTRFQQVEKDLFGTQDGKPMKAKNK